MAPGIHVRQVLDGCVQHLEHTVPEILAQNRELGGLELGQPAVIEISRQFDEESRLPYVALSILEQTDEVDWATPQRDTTIPLTLVVVSHGNSPSDSERIAWEWGRILDLAMGGVGSTVPQVWAFHTRNMIVEMPFPEVDAFRRHTFVYTELMLRTTRPRCSLR